jgi:class 3 adenylate cyclase/tetratricopeptide (TPR) repeat protein
MSTEYLEERSNTDTVHPLEQIPQIYAQKMQVAREARSMQGERRVVTILFCDVAGSTQMAGGLDPEIWAEIMHEAFDYMVGPIYRYEGTVARLMGDAVLAFFGAPIAHEDDAERAARAGLEILSGIQPFAEDIKEEFGIDFDLRVGINTGPVVVGEIGTDLAMEYTAMGDAANIAARMEQTAEPGTLQISEDTFRRIEKLFRTESLGSIELKGKAQPVEAYCVLEAHSHPGRTRGIEGLTAPLVGRSAEFEQLQQVIVELETGRGAIFTLLGEAGLGKSRLIDEISRWAHEQAESKAEWLFASGVSYNMSLPFGVFRRMLRALIGVEESSPPAETSQKIVEFVEQLPPDLQNRSQIAFKIILGLELDAESAEMDAEARKREVFLGMAELLQWLSKRNPLVMVLDDLHWADPVSVELISYLFRLSDEIPVLYLCSLRPHRKVAGWEIKLRGETDFPHRYSEITLQPLSAQHSEELIDALLRVSNLPTNLRELIKSKAEGNPFFVEEVIRMLIEQGIIARDEERDQWFAVKEPDEVIIPDNLNGLLTARIDRLPAETRTTLQYAAVIGRSFDQPVLASVIESNGYLQDHLSTLQRHELIREVRRLPEVQYMFTHELTRDAAYSTLLRRQRRRFHRKVGETLEALYSERLEEFAGRLGYHFQQAGQQEKARNYFDEAGDHAASLYANGEAIEYYRREMALVPQDEVGSDSWTRLLLKLGRVHEMSGSWQEALSLYRQIEDQGIQQSNPRLELEGLLPQVTIYSVPTDVRDRDSGPALAERALEIAESLQDPEATAKTLWNLLLQHFYMGLDYRKGLESGERALEIAREYDLKELLPFILNDLGRAYSSTYRFDESIKAQKEAESLWRASGNMPMLADNLTTAADLLFGIGEFEKSIQYAEEALEISRRIGNLWGQAYSMMVYAGTKVERGEISEAIAMIQECVRIGSEGNFFAASIFPPIYLTWTYSWLGATDLAMEHADDPSLYLDEFPAFKARAQLIKAYVHLIRGEVDRAYELYVKWHDELEVIVPDLFATALTWVIAGEILVRKGMVDEAMSIAGRLENFAEKGGGMWCFSDVCLLKARVMMGQGKLEEGRRFLLMAEEDSARIGSKRGQLNSLAACIEHLSSSWDDSQKQKIAQKSTALLNFLEEHIESESLHKAFLRSAPASVITDWLSNLEEISI